MTDLQKLKFNVREHQVPYFTDEELEYLLELYGDVEKASYEALILKAENTGLDVSGITTKDSSSYFKMLASHFARTNSGILE
uniref:Uncharacterized protein n=1 Tax=Dulem virus 36 TaxID=3145754 RepID=A0AAU8AYC0_9CAUD